MLTILSAVAGGYDTRKRHVEQTVPVHWVHLDMPVPAGVHPRTVAKEPKLFPWEFTDDECSVWIDASYRVTSPTFAADMLAVLERTDLAQFRHPERRCIYDEAAFSKAMAKYHGQPLDGQTRHYFAEGHPLDWGLWECGLLVRRHTPKIRALSEDWSAELEAWSWQDQVSWPVVLRLHDVRPVELPGFHLDNPWLSWEGHLRAD